MIHLCRNTFIPSANSMKSMKLLFLFSRNSVDSSGEFECSFDHSTGIPLMNSITVQPLLFPLKRKCLSIHTDPAVRTKKRTKPQRITTTHHGSGRESFSGGL